MRRVVIDTNVWVSAVLNPSGPPAQVLHALQAHRFLLVLSEPLLDKLAEVLSRPRITDKYGVAASDVQELVALLRELGEVVSVTGRVQLCRDPDDNVVIETALTGHAGNVITRDDDLKGDSELVRALAARRVEVLTVRRFLALLDEERGVQTRATP